jgi:uncharacterized membrane protein
MREVGARNRGRRDTTVGEREATPGKEEAMRKFSVRPTLTMRGRKFKGVRGWAGKPLHPPLTDFPVAAYIFGAAFDVIASFGRHDAWGRDFFRAGTFVFIAGAAVSVFAALTGFWDWLRSTEKGTQARRTANTHAWTMITVTVLALVDIALRLNVYHTRTHPNVAILVLSLVVAGLVSFGATFGGTLVYDYGFNVETAGDSPVWHQSESDVFPGDHAA